MAEWPITDTTHKWPGTGPGGILEANSKRLEEKEVQLPATRSGHRQLWKVKK